MAWFLHRMVWKTIAGRSDTERRLGQSESRLHQRDRGRDYRNTRGDRAGSDRRGRFRGRSLFSGLVSAPLVMPEVITGISLLLLHCRGRFAKEIE